MYCVGEKVTMFDMTTLNQNQADAVQWNAGPLLVLAGPGSGKTKTLVTRVARILLESAHEPFRILCLTFTKKAASEMRTRLLALVPGARDRALLTTFHSFAADILRTHGSHLGLTPDFEIIEDADRIAIIKVLFAARPDDFDRFLTAEKALSAIDFLFANVAQDEKIPTMLQDQAPGVQLQALFVAYKQALLQQNALDYGAILYFCEQLLRTMPKLVKQLDIVYRYICVDEFQDTNVAQYQLLRTLKPARNSNLFIVGDDDQIIYGWNGASPKRIQQLRKDYNLKTIQLPENYRCPPKVVAMANALIAHNRERTPDKKPLLAMSLPESEIPVTVIQSRDEAHEALWVTDQIVKKIEGGIPPLQIAVLARTTKLLERVAGRLQRAGIDAHVHKRQSQFESAPLRFIVVALKLAVVRADQTLAATVSKALSDCIMRDVLEQEVSAWAAQTNGDYLEALGSLVAQFPELHPTWHDALTALRQGQYKTFLEAIFRYVDDLSVDAGEDEVFANYATERAVWQDIVNDLGGTEQAYNLSLAQFLQELVLANKTPAAPPTAVRCLTIHASKGMEFNHVYLIGLAEDILPSFQSKKAGNDSREMEEERRSCFVAITRTIETLTLSYANSYSGWPKKPSRFLYEMNDVES
jgi:DNA helicase II / ATP-dependent DNA helicase PcrA